MYVFKPISYKNVVNPVDLSSFRPDAENVRALKFNPVGSMGVNPKYDFSDGVDNGKVTDMMVRLRSGRFDKAELEDIKRNLDSIGRDNLDKAKADAIDKASLYLAESINAKNAKKADEK